MPFKKMCCKIFITIFNNLSTFICSVSFIGPWIQYAGNIALDVEMCGVCHVVLKVLNISDQQKIEHKNLDRIRTAVPIKLKYAYYTLSFQNRKFALRSAA
jgi:hypothetical protein